MTNPPVNPSKPELSEKDFVHEEFVKNPYPFWLWIFLITTIVALFWGGRSWYGDYIQTKVEMSPFLQVTNREFSLFLWQNPEYMRVHTKNKSGYLTGFQYTDKVSLELEFADKYVVAPPDIIFLYHVWHRLVSNEFTPRPIPLTEFLEFLAYAEEWYPRNWPAAPPGYIKLIEGISTHNLVQEVGGGKIDPDDLQTLPHSSLPQSVRMAFQGWKNYFKEGELINRIKPNYLDVEGFLSSHPHYARNYWRNIVQDQYPRYLFSLSSDEIDRLSYMPSQEMTPLFKVAIFNYLKGKSNE